MPYTYDYPRPAVTVDAVVFQPTDNNSLKILLIERLQDPFKGMWALPGGFVDEQETLEEAVSRELEEETGLKGIKLYQLEAFSAPGRDPRHRTISIAFWGFCKKAPRLQPGSDAAEARWVNIEQLPPLAFDHEVMIKKALKRALELIAI